MAQWKMIKSLKLGLRKNASEKINEGINEMSGKKRNTPVLKLKYEGF